MAGSDVYKGSTRNILVATAVPQILVAEYEIVTVPAAIAFTNPLLPTVAIAVLLLVHIPGAPLLEYVPVEPSHMLPEPEIVPALGDGFTVTETLPQLPGVTQLPSPRAK
jgi:hypothetical protein